MSGLSQFVGGPPGRHARSARTTSSVAPALAAVTVLTMLVGWLLHSPCRGGGWPDGIQYTRLCYSDVVALYAGRGLDQGLVPYLQSDLEYPVLLGLVMWLSALITPDSWGVAGFADVTAVVLTACAVATVVLLVQLGSRRSPARPWDAALMAASPVLVLVGLLNWDLVPVLLATAGLYAWSREMPVWAGALWGVGAAAKIWPAFLLGVVLVLGWRCRAVRPALVATAAGAIAWLAVNLPVYLAAPDGWRYGWEFQSARYADWGTTWHLVQKVLGVTLAPTLLNVLSLAAFAVSCLAVAALAMRARVAPEPAELGLLLVGAFLLTGKVWSPQFSLWLLPFVALAVRRWAPALLWQSAEAFYLVAVFLHLRDLTTEQTRLPEWIYLLGTLVRAIAVALLCALVVRRILARRSTAAPATPTPGVADLPDPRDQPSNRLDPGPHPAALVP